MSLACCKTARWLVRPGNALLVFCRLHFKHRRMLSLRAAGPYIGRLLDASTGLFGLSIIFTLVGLVPINNRIACLDPSNPPANWLELRKRWDRLHLVRIIILLIALLLLALGEVICPR